MGWQDLCFFVLFLCNGQPSAFLDTYLLNPCLWRVGWGGC